MYMTYMYIVTLYHKNPCPGGHEMYNFGRPFLDHHAILYAQFVWCIPGDREEFFLKNYINFKRFLLKIISPWGGRGSWNFLFSYLTDATHQIWLRLVL